LVTRCHGAYRVGRQFSKLLFGQTHQARHAFSAQQRVDRGCIFDLLGECPAPVVSGKDHHGVWFKLQSRQSEITHFEAHFAPGEIDDFHSFLSEL
jgi:hypothetical protein